MITEKQEEALQKISDFGELQMSLEDREELERLRKAVNTPHTKDWMHATEMEAVHQQERWGQREDKSPSDWFWLVGYLAGKALAAFIKGDREKGLHHIISTSAALLNWHRTVTKEKDHA